MFYIKKTLNFEEIVNSENSENVPTVTKEDRQKL